MLLMLFLQPAIWGNETIELYKFIGKRYYHDHDSTYCVELWDVSNSPNCGSDYMVFTGIVLCTVKLLF